MTNQEAFDKMMNHIRSLPERNVNRMGNCVYNESMCAIGSLLTDEEQEAYGDSHRSVKGLLNDMERDGHTSALHSLDVRLLSEMQRLHDSESNWYPKTGFSYYGEIIAKDLSDEYGLVYTAPVSEGT